MGELVKVEILTKKDLSSFKDGVVDAILHGTRDSDNRNHYYKRGYEFGITVYADFMVQMISSKRERKKSNDECRQD